MDETEMLEETRKQIMGNIKWGKKPIHKGGQSVGLVRSIVTLKSDDIDIEINIGYHRSQIKNAQLALTLFELALSDLIK